MPWTSRRLAHDKNALASSDICRPLWNLSKREILEVALHFGQRLNHDFSINGAVNAVKSEIEILKQHNLI